jgi:AcrR family transcriptional regulator
MTQGISRFVPALDHRNMTGRILAAANGLFMQSGYALTSMDAVAKMAGISKSTLYSHFESKEHLFGAVIHQARQSLHDSLATVTTVGEQDAEKMLRQIGTQYLRFITQADSITMYRLVIAESAHLPDLGRDLFQSCSNLIAQLIGESLRSWNEKGLVSIANPIQAARQFLALLKSDLQLRCLLDPRRVTDEAEIQANVNSAVTLFLGLYARQQK